MNHGCINFGPRRAYVAIGEGLACPDCKSRKSFVVDSRPDKENNIRRRRECLACKQRFTTYERIHELTQVVEKKLKGTDI